MSEEQMSKRANERLPNPEFFRSNFVFGLTQKRFKIFQKFDKWGYRGSTLGFEISKNLKIEVQIKNQKLPNFYEIQSNRT